MHVHTDELKTAKSVIRYTMPNTTPDHEPPVTHTPQPKLRLSNIFWRVVKGNPEPIYNAELKEAAKNSYTAAIALKDRKIATIKHVSKGLRHTSISTVEFVDTHKKQIATFLAAVAVGTPIIGWPGKTVSEEDAAQSMRQRQVSRYDSMSPAEKYSAAFTDPWTLHENNREGGFGILGALSSGTYTRIMGEKCLAGTPFDLKPRSIVSGGTTSPATLKPTSVNTFDIVPDDKSPNEILRFSLAPLSNNTTPVLIPNNPTTNILIKNGCTPVGIHVNDSDGISLSTLFSATKITNP